MKTTLAALALALSLPLLAQADPASSGKKSKASVTKLVDRHADRRVGYTSTVTTTSAEASSPVTTPVVPYSLPHSGISTQFMTSGAAR
ncbi:hypothetical protein BH09VER1_BH09VER1_37740 [soil metagenome]